MQNSTEVLVSVPIWGLFNLTYSGRNLTRVYPFQDKFPSPSGDYLI